MYKGEDLRELIENKLLDNDSVNQIWGSITRYLPNEQLRLYCLKKLLGNGLILGPTHL